MMRKCDAFVMRDRFERSPSVVAFNISTGKEKGVSDTFRSGLSGFNCSLVNSFDGRPEAVLNWDLIPFRFKANMI